MKKYYIPTGYYWLDEVEVEESDSRADWIEEIALACKEQKKGVLVKCIELSNDEFDEYDNDEQWTYVDLTPWGYDCYFFLTYGIKEVE